MLGLNDSLHLDFSGIKININVILLSDFIVCRCRLELEHFFYNARFITPTINMNIHTNGSFWVPK